MVGGYLEKKGSQSMPNSHGVLELSGTSRQSHYRCSQEASLRPGMGTRRPLPLRCLGDEATHTGGMLTCGLISCSRLELHGRKSVFFFLIKIIFLPEYKSNKACSPKKHTYVEKWGRRKCCLSQNVRLLMCNQG